MIRRAEKKDKDKILDLLAQVKKVHVDGRPDLFKAGLPKYNEEELIKMMSDDENPMFVACDENDYVLGYAICQFKVIKDDSVLKDMRYLYIDDLCVDEKHRGHHFGKSLYEYVLQYAKNNNCQSVMLNVWSCNQDALKFYEAVGMKSQRIYMEKSLM